MDTIDPELKYCLKCEDEYRADIEACGGCGGRLVSGNMLLAVLQEKRGKSVEKRAISTGDALVAIQAGSMLDMKNLKRILEKASIPAIISSDDNCRSGCCGPTVTLQIRSQDLELAQTVLSIEHAASTRLHEYEEVIAEVTFDPTAARATCPACGHTFVPDRQDCPECGLFLT